MFMKNSRLYKAASRGDLKSVKKLLAAGADCNGKMGREGARPLMTPLMAAALNGHRDVVQALVASGTNLERKNREGCTALSFAISEGHTEVARDLLDAGANPDVPGGLLKTTSLQDAATYGNAEAVALLLEYGADPDRMDNVWGQSALHQAAKSGHERVVTLLLAADATVDLRCKDGSTALHWACYYKRPATARVLLDAGADPTAKDEAGRVPLMFVESGEQDAFELGMGLSGAEGSVQQGWKRTGADEVAYSRNLLDRELTEVFNFISRERLTFSRNTATNTEVVLRDRFESVSPEDIRKAAAELVKLGGNKHTGMAEKIKVSVKIEF